MTTQSVAKTDGAVVELVSFTAQELDIITHALRVTNSYYQSLVESANIPGDATAQADVRRIFMEQAREAGVLQLKIEAAR